MASGIYVIVHRDSGRWYVGQSKNIEKRWATHRSDLRSAIHVNSRLQNAWTKYGEDAFDFAVLILAPVWMLNDLEQAYLDDPQTSQFNIGKDATSGMRGRTHTKECRDMISKIQIGRKQSPDTVAKRIASNTGRKRTPEQRARMSESMRGRTKSPEHRAKIAASLRGRKAPPRSAEHAAKIGAAQIGRKLSPETIAKRTASRRANGSYEPKPKR